MLDQELRTFDEFIRLLEAKSGLLGQILPNVYDYERFFRFKIENDFVVINEDALPEFTRYCRALLQNPFMKMECLFPKIALIQRRQTSALAPSEPDPRILHSSNSNLANSKHLPAIESALQSKRVAA